MFRKGFTLVEAMVCLLALTVMTIAMVRFGNTISIRIGETSEKCSDYMSEYQDVSNIRASTEVPTVNHSDYLTLVEQSGGLELWKYSGKYLEIYKLYGVD